MKANSRIKKANVITVYTPEQLEELDRCMYGYTDPDTGKHTIASVYFAKNYARIQHPTLGDIPFDMYDYQEEMMEMFQNNNKSICLSARQTGKEQPHNAKIATASGWTTMGDVKVGDFVLTPDGQSVPVLDKFPQGFKDVYKVTFNDGSWAECGLDHLWTCYIRNNNGNTYAVQKQTVTLDYIIKHMDKYKDRSDKNNYNVRIPVLQCVNFNPQNLPIDPYLLGLLLGDGSLSNGGVRFTTKDDEIVQSLNVTLAQYQCKLVPNANMSKWNGMDYYIVKNDQCEQRNNPILELLRDVGLMGTTSFTKFVPEQYLLGSHEQRLSLLQGLMDTDGTVLVRENKRTISYCTTSPTLRDSVQQLVWSLGGRCSIMEREPKQRTHLIAYELFISLPNPKDCFRLSRKKDKCHDKWNCGKSNESEIRRTIVSVEKVRQDECSCIMIDHPDHLYITDNYTVTHNSVSSGVFLLWFAIFNPNSTILIASNKNANAMEMIKRIQYTYECLPHWMKPGVVDGGWNKHELGFDNDSRILSQATSANTGRGLSITLLFLDEFAFVRPSIQEEFWTSILPTLSTGGACIITSTPNGSTDKFSAIWRAAVLSSSTDDMQFAHMHVKWDAPPKRDEKFKRAQIKLLGQAKWDQEYECKFISNDPLLIDPITLASLEDRTRTTISSTNIGFDFYQPIKQGRTYLIGIDPSTGTKQDFGVLVCYDFTDMSLVAMLRSNTLNSPQLYATCKWFFNYIKQQGGNAYFTVENNGIGEGFIALYESDESFPEGIDFITEAEGNRLGFRTEGRSKLRMCLTFKQLVEAGKIDVAEDRLIKELKSFIQSKGSYAAQVGATDDIISATLLVVRLLEEIAIYEQRAFDVMNQFDQVESDGPTFDDTEDIDVFDDNYVPDGFVL